MKESKKLKVIPDTIDEVSLDSQQVGLEVIYDGAPVKDGVLVSWAHETSAGA